MPLTAERREQALRESLTPQQFIEEVQDADYRARLESGYAATEFPPELLAQFEAVLSAPLDVLALVEETSTDVIFNLPILMKLADLTGKLRLYILLREQNRDIAGQYLLKSGHNHLPTYIFYDGNGREIGTFIERPFFVTMQMAEWFEAFWRENPSLPGYGSLPGQMPPETRRVLHADFHARREPYRAQEATAILEHVLDLVRASE
jgi:hypothetical protein